MNIIQPTSMFDLSHKIGGGVVVVVVVGECVCVCWGGGGGMGFLDWYLSTTYASNGLENWLSLICTNIKLSL